MESIVLIIAMTVSNIACLIIGASVMQKAERNEPIELPELNPAKAWQKRREEKEMQRLMEEQAIIEGNIERYNGTAEGQEDVEVRSKWI